MTWTMSEEIIKGSRPDRQQLSKEADTMRKNLTEIVFIIDKSGSMSGLELDTIGGFNSMLRKQREEEGEAYVSRSL